MQTTQSPFKGRVVAFLGNPTKCTRPEAKYELSLVGGVFKTYITPNTNYVVAFDGANKTAAFEKAKTLADSGCLQIINEDEFFELL